MINMESILKYFTPHIRFSIIDKKYLITEYYLEYKNDIFPNERGVTSFYVYEVEDSKGTSIETSSLFRREETRVFEGIDIKEWMKNEPSLEYEKRHKEAIEVIRKEVEKEELKKFSKEMNMISKESIRKFQGKLLSRNLVNVEYWFETDKSNRNFILSLNLKVGIDKMYYVKNLYEFFEAIYNFEVITYGKSLSFNHQIENFNPQERELLLFISKLGFETDSTHKSMQLDEEMFYLIIDRLKGRVCYFDKYPFYIRLEEQEINLSIDKDYCIHHDCKYPIVACFANVYIFNTDEHCIDIVKCSKQNVDLFRLFMLHEGICIKEIFDEFYKKTYVYFNNYITLAPEIEENFNVGLFNIEAYFDMEDATILLNTKYLLGNKEITDFDLDSLTEFEKIKYEQYNDQINELGFVDNQLTEEDAVYRFLTTDLSYLKDQCKVFLSESIKNKQVVKFQTPTLHVSYEGNLLTFLFENLKYDRDELKDILSAIRKKKKYYILDKNTIIDLTDKKATNFYEMIEDLQLKEDEICDESQGAQRPLYQSFKLHDYSDNVTIDDHVEQIIKEIANFKMAKYNVPKVNATLRPYQEEGYRWLKVLSCYNLGGILADDMGLGKTLEIITLLKSDNILMPSLIICPKSLIFNWKREFEKFDPETTIIEIGGSVSERKKIIKSIDPNDKIIYITSYDLLRNDTYPNDLQFNYAIVDEGQYIKNAHAQKTISVKQVNAIHRFVLTGTPIENNVFDLWSLFDFVMPGYLEKLSLFKTKINEDGFLDNLNKKVAPFILRRTKKEVLTDLPPKSERIVTTGLNKMQQQIYDAYVLKAQETEKSEKNPVAVFGILTRLRQICIDPSMFIDNYTGGSEKMKTLTELLEELIVAGHKMLVFSPFVECLELIEAELTKKDIPHFLYTGKSSDPQRKYMTDTFNETDEVKVFLISLKVGGVGLNLTGGDVVVHVSPWWNSAAEDQATDRAYRIGQTKKVEVIRLICSKTVEQRAIEIQKHKKDLVDKLISNDDSSITNLTKEDVKYILS